MHYPGEKGTEGVSFVTEAKNDEEGLFVEYFLAPAQI